MKKSIFAAFQIGLLTAAVVCSSVVLPPLAAAQTTPAIPPSLSTPDTGQIQVPIPKTPADVPGPVPGNTMTDAYVQLVGRMAYMWGYPLVNAHNRRVAFAGAPEPGLLGGVVPVAPVGFNEMLTNYLKQTRPSLSVLTRMLRTGRDSPHSTKNLRWFRCRTSVTAFTSTQCMTSAPTRSAGSASSMARSPAFT